MSTEAQDVEPLIAWESEGGSLATARAKKPLFRANAMLGDLIEAAYDAAAAHSNNPRMVSRLAATAVRELLSCGVRRGTPRR